MRRAVVFGTIAGLALIASNAASAEPFRVAQAVFSDSLPGYEVTSIARSLGYDPMGRPARRGAHYVVRAIDPDGGEVRVTVDAHYGDVVAVTPIPPANVGTANGFHDGPNALHAGPYEPVLPPGPYGAYPRVPVEQAYGPYSVPEPFANRGYEPAPRLHEPIARAHEPGALGYQAAPPVVAAEPPEPIASAAPQVITAVPRSSADVSPPAYPSHRAATHQPASRVVASAPVKPLPKPRPAHAHAGSKSKSTENVAANAARADAKAPPAQPVAVAPQHPFKQPQPQPIAD